MVLNNYSIVYCQDSRTDIDHESILSDTIDQNSGGEPEPLSSDSMVFSVMATEVVPNVYQQRLAHAKVVYLSEQNLLVDTAPESEWERLVEFLDDRGAVNTLFLSHGHGDHIGNAEKVIERFDPEVLIPENEPLDDLNLEDSSITEVSDGEVITDGVEVVEIPGHTQGICALYLPDKETLLATDVLDGADRRGLPSEYLLPPPGKFNWNSDAAEENLEKLLELSFETAIVTHGTNVEESARLKLEKFLNFTEYYRQDLLDRLS